MFPIKQWQEKNLYTEHTDNLQDVAASPGHLLAVYNFYLMKISGKTVQLAHVEEITLQKQFCFERCTNLSTRFQEALETLSDAMTDSPTWSNTDRPHQLVFIYQTSQHTQILLKHRSINTPICSPVRL